VAVLETMSRTSLDGCQMSISNSFDSAEYVITARDIFRQRLSVESACDHGGILVR
jgi:hypothetical protein